MRKVINWSVLFLWHYFSIDLFGWYFVELQSVLIWMLQCGRCATPRRRWKGWGRCRWTSSSPSSSSSSNTIELSREESKTKQRQRHKELFKIFSRWSPWCEGWARKASTVNYFISIHSSSSPPQIYVATVVENLVFLLICFNRRLVNSSQYDLYQ